MTTYDRRGTAKVASKDNRRLASKAPRRRWSAMARNCKGDTLHDTPDCGLYFQRRSGRPFKHKSKKGRQSVEVAGIAVAIAAAVISSISAFYAYRAYQSQQDASKRAMADQVVIVAPPLSSDRVDQLRKQHPVNYIDYFPMYVRNYGRLPVLGLIAEADINGKKMQSRTIGTLLPCTEVEVGDVLRAALSETGSRNNWSVVITFQDVAGQSWKRSLSGAPAPIKDNRFVLREGTGIATGHVDGCQAG